MEGREGEDEDKDKDEAKDEAKDEDSVVDYSSIILLSVSIHIFSSTICYVLSILTSLSISLVRCWLHGVAHPTASLLSM